MPNANAPPGGSSGSGWAALATAALAVLAALAFLMADQRSADTDLFPRWYGLRQLLVHARNPYSVAVTREIAERTSFLGPAGAETPNSVETAFAFLYPLPGVLLLAPLALLPYQAAHALWLVLGFVALPAAALLALGTSANLGNGAAHHLHESPAGRLAIALSLLFLPSLWNLLLAQPGIAVVFLVALALRLAAHRPACAGAALTGATLLKPQMVALLAPCWIGHHLWHARRSRSHRFLLGAGGAGATLVAAATALLPSWPVDFLHAAHQYPLVSAMAPSSPAVYVLSGAVLPDNVARSTTVVACLAAVLWTTAGWRVSEAAGAYRALLAGALVIPPAWETSAVMLLIPLSMSLAGLSGRRAYAFVVASAVLTVLLAPLSVIWPWRAGALVSLAYVLLSVSGAAEEPGAVGPPGRESPAPP